MSIDERLTAHKGQIKGDAQSRVDLFSGQHTTSLIVALLFILALIGLVLYILCKDKYENVIITGFFSLLSVLGGFFAGSQLRKR